MEEIFCSGTAYPLKITADFYTGEGSALGASLFSNAHHSGSHPRAYATLLLFQTDPKLRQSLSKTEPTKRPNPTNTGTLPTQHTSCTCQRHGNFEKEFLHN
jgi:hypothetical protein